MYIQYQFYIYSLTSKIERNIGEMKVIIFQCIDIVTSHDITFVILTNQKDSNTIFQQIGASPCARIFPWMHLPHNIVRK